MKKTNVLQNGFAKIIILLIGSLMLFTGCPDPSSQEEDSRTRLAAGPAVQINADQTEAVVTFTGASGLELDETDFAVTTGASFTDVDVDNGTVSLTVTFPVNTDAGPKIYTVSIDRSSEKIRGAGTVVITQYGTDGASGVIVMKLVNQSAGSSNTPNNDSFLTLNKVSGEEKWQWSGNPVQIVSAGSPRIDASGTANDSGIIDGTLLYADIVQDGNFTMEARMRITQNTPNVTGVVVGVVGNAPGFSASENFKGFVGLVHRAGEFRHMHPFDVEGGIGLGVNSANNDVPSTSDFFTYTYTINGDGTIGGHYSGSIIRGGGLANVPGVPGGQALSAIVANASRYPGIIVYNATVEITEITLTIDTSDPRTVLTPGAAPTILSGTTEVNVTYTGDAAELAALNLTAADFDIASSAAIDGVDVTNNTVTVTIIIDDPNMTAANRTFVLSTDSDDIVADNVTITQSPRKEPVAGGAVAVDADETSASVTFTGVQGLTTADIEDDFMVVTGEANIDNVSVNGDSVTVDVTFTAIGAGDAIRTFIIGIDTDSIHIRGNATVTITQGETRVWLTPGDPVSADDDAEEATATFTGATGLTLTAGDFTVISGNADIGTVSVDDDTVNVQVTFDANTDTSSAKTYIVGINPASTVIVGTDAATVTITQAAAPLQSIVMKLINQPEATNTNTANNDSFLILERVGGQNAWRWTAPNGAPETIVSTGSGGIAAGGNSNDIGIAKGTLLYADIVQNGNFTLEVKMRVFDNTNNQTGAIVGVIGDAPGFSASTNTDFKGFVGLLHRPGQFRHLNPFDVEGGVALRTNSNDDVPSGLLTYTYTVNGDGTNRTHYSGRIVQGDGLPDVPGEPGGEQISTIVTGVNRYPGIIVFNATVEIAEITLTAITP